MSDHEKLNPRDLDAETCKLLSDLEDELEGIDDEAIRLLRQRIFRRLAEAHIAYTTAVRPADLPSVRKAIDRLIASVEPSIITRTRTAEHERLIAGHGLIAEVEAVEIARMRATAARPEPKAQRIIDDWKNDPVWDQRVWYFHGTERGGQE